MEKTAIIILNWNGAQMLRTYLPSVIAHTKGAEIIVADNGSTDDSLEVLRKEIPSDRLGYELWFCGRLQQSDRTGGKRLCGAA